MSTAIDDSRIIIPFMPPLLHFASVKIAFTLLKEFDNKTLSAGFTIICNGPFVESNQRRQESCKAIDNNIEKSILFIPVHLRSAVIKAVHGVHYSYLCWLRRHSNILNLRGEKKRIIYWRSNGEIHRIKTAQQLVRNINIDIIERFDIACMYCFEESMQTLWAEMEASGVTKNIKTNDESMSSFGVRWLRDGCRVPWARAALKYLNPRESFGHPIPRFSSFLPLLQSNNRQRFLCYLMFSTIDDIRFCLHTVTKEEKAQCLKWHVRIFLILHLHWPMQSLFLETTEKMWDSISGEDFIHLLDTILNYNNIKKDFDYGELFESLWIRSPNHLRESASLCPILSEKMNKYLNEKRRKRESDDEKKENSET